jgi:hypothetical protein
MIIWNPVSFVFPMLAGEIQVTMPTAFAQVMPSDADIIADS